VCGPLAWAAGPAVVPTPPRPGGSPLGSITCSGTTRSDRRSTRHARRDRLHQRLRLRGHATSRVTQEAASRRVTASQCYIEAAERGAVAAANAQVGPAVAVAVWTDGACTSNPGPAGLDDVVIEGGERRELSEFLGEGTNNIAERMAIYRGLDLVRDRSEPIFVYSDSGYSIGSTSKNWKAKANIDLVARLRDLASSFPTSATSKSSATPASSKTSAATSSPRHASPAAVALDSR
jgi:ribonuclease HI